MSYDDNTMREIVALEIAQLSAVNDVYDADTADAPNELDMPWAVVRWYDRLDGMGRLWRRPFDVWVYVPLGDRQPGEDIAHDIAARLTALNPGIAKRNGFVNQIEDLGIGGDLRDDDYEALVVVQHMRAVASGD